MKVESNETTYVCIANRIIILSIRAFTDFSVSFPSSSHVLLIFCFTSLVCLVKLWTFRCLVLRHLVGTVSNVMKWLPIWVLSSLIVAQLQWSGGYLSSSSSSSSLLLMIIKTTVKRKMSTCTLLWNWKKCGTWKWRWYLLELVLLVQSPKDWLQGQEDLEIRGQVEITQTTAL